MNARPMSPSALLLEGALYGQSQAQRANFKRAANEVAALVKAAQDARTSLQHMRGPEALIHARTAQLDEALAKFVP